MTDRLLAPATVNGSTVLVRSGVSGLFGGLRYEPVRRRVSFVPDARAFRRSLQYEFVIGSALRAWDGAPLANPTVVRFTPGAAEAPLPRRVPSLASEVAPLMVARCGRAECHGGDTPLMGLDLSSRDAIVRTSVRVPSRQRAPAASGVVTSIDPAWGALMRVDPGTVDGQGRPEYSYLIYKILGDGPIIGQRMPPDGAPLSLDEAALISDWIAAGAPAN